MMIAAPLNYPSRAPECTRFAAFATRCVKEGTEMQGLLETGQRVKMRFCMTSFSCLSGTLRSPVVRASCIDGRYFL
jgi:hypothetical protein